MGVLSESLHLFGQTRIDVGGKNLLGLSRSVLALVVENLVFGDDLAHRQRCTIENAYRKLAP